MLKNKKIKFITLALLVLIFTSMFGSPALAAMSIRVGYKNYGDFVTADDKGNITGGPGGEILLEVLKTCTNYSFDMNHYDESAYVAKIQQGYGILGAYLPDYGEKNNPGSITYTSVPIGTEYGVMYVLPETDLHYEDYESFDGMKVGTLLNNQQTSIFNAYAKEKGFSVDMVEYETIEKMSQALKDGAVQAIIYGCPAELTEFKIVDRYSELPLYLVASNWGKEFVSNLNGALEKIKEADPNFAQTYADKYYADKKAMVALTFEEEAAIAEQQAQEEEARKQAEEEEARKKAEEEAKKQAEEQAQQQSGGSGFKLPDFSSIDPKYFGIGAAVLAAALIAVVVARRKANQEPDEETERAFAPIDFKEPEDFVTEKDEETEPASDYSDSTEINYPDSTDSPEPQDFEPESEKPDYTELKPEPDCSTLESEPETVKKDDSVITRFINSIKPAPAPEPEYTEPEPVSVIDEPVSAPEEDTIPVAVINKEEPEEDIIEGETVEVETSEDEVPPTPEELTAPQRGINPNPDRTVVMKHEPLVLTHEDKIDLKALGIKVFLQPGYGVDTEKGVGAEAKGLYMHHIRGMIHPEKLLDTLERNNQIHLYDRYIFNVVGETGATHYLNKEKFRIIIPVSHYSLKKKNFQDWYISAAKRHDLDVTAIRLDIDFDIDYITASQLEGVKQLKEAGFGIGIKNVGAPNYPLELIGEVKPDAVIIDDSVLYSSDKKNLESGARLVELKAYCFRNGIHMEANNIDSREAFQLAIESGCSVLRGNFLSRPVPLENK